MTPPTPETMRFDPFSDRLSRDIRNTLSQAFMRSLETGSDRHFLDTVGKWLDRRAGIVYDTYIRDRRARYARVLDQVRKHTLTTTENQIPAVWNEGLFFEVHEVLESIWHQSSGPRRDALKGLIQAAGVYVHLERGHRKGAERLALKAAANLKRNRSEIDFISNLDGLLTAVERLESIPPRLEADRK